jgi:hypothetical protein
VTVTFKVTVTSLSGRADLNRAAMFFMVTHGPDFEQSGRADLNRAAMFFMVTHGPDFEQSGRADLNRRPHGPEPCALAGLSHAPIDDLPFAGGNYTMA